MAKIILILEWEYIFSLKMIKDYMKGGMESVIAVLIRVAFFRNKSKAP